MTEEGLRAQYVKSVDPEVLAIVERNLIGRQSALNACSKWSEAQGADGLFYPETFAGCMGVQSLPFEAKPAGWVQAGRNRDRYRPKKGTALYVELKALHWSPEKVPGIADYYEAPNRSGSGDTWWLWAVPFLSHGAAWVILSHMPNRGTFGPQWSEVKASEAHAAREALTEEKAA